VISRLRMVVLDNKIIFILNSSHLTFYSLHAIQVEKCNCVGPSQAQQTYSYDLHPAVGLDLCEVCLLDVERTL
jgi:hypothetical protein